MAKKEKQPWFKFYPSDWDSDPCLRQASLAAQGLWIRIINLAHHSNGYLLVGGQQPTSSALSIIIGRPEVEIVSALKELEKFGVFSRTKEGIIYSRRMTKGARISGKNSVNGSKGGRPKSKNNNDDLDLGFKIESEPENPTTKPDTESEEKSLYAEAYAYAYAEANAEADNSVPIGTGVGKPPPAADKILIDGGRSLLAKYGIPDGKARSLIGKWRKDVSDERLAGVFEHAGSQERAEIVAYIQGCLVEKKQPKDSQILVDWLYGLQGGPMKRTTAEFQVESWVSTLGLDAVTQAITKAKSVGWKRDKTIEHLDSLAAGKNRDSYEKPKQTAPAPPENQHWANVRDTFCNEDPRAKSWLGDMVKAVSVNGSTVKIRAASRVGAEQIEKYGPRLLDLFRIEKPGIEIVEVGL